jgi:signal transduction histidine kinase
MTATVRQLLDFARRRRPEKRRTNLAKVVRDVRGLLAPLAAKRGVSIEDCTGAGPLTADVDPDQIHQALANLVVNALQASHRGGRVAIEGVSSFETPPVGEQARAGRYVRISVRDQGEGISAESLPRIFDPFFTTKEVGEGTGLGLCVSHGIVEEHGGWIEVRSEPGKGSVFSVLLPCEPDERAELEEERVG